jgi:hypothetical protein
VERETRFGDARTLLFSTSAGGSKTWYDGTSASTSGVDASLGGDYFIASHVSLGVAGGFGFGESAGFERNGQKTIAERWGYYVQPRLGGDLPLASRLSLYTRAGISFGENALDLESGPTKRSEKTFIVTLAAETFLLVHVASHAFLGVGPFVTYDLERRFAGSSISFPATSVGGRTIVGLWF